MWDIAKTKAGSNYKLMLETRGTPLKILNTTKIPDVV